MEDKASFGVIAAVKDALNRQRSNAFRAARAAGLPDNSIRYLLEGRETKLSRLIEICRALDLEFYIGPPRDHSRSRSERSVSEIVGLDRQNSEVPEAPGRPYNVTSLDLVGSVTNARTAELLARLADRCETATETERGQLESAITAVLDLAGAKKATEIHGRFSAGANPRKKPEGWLDERRLRAMMGPVEMRWIERRKIETGDENGPVPAFVPRGWPLDIYMQATSPPVPVKISSEAAGEGAINIDDAETKDVAWFSRGWLDRYKLDSTKCIVYGVRGESMEPELPSGCSILVARHRRTLLEGQLFVISMPGGLVVKRVERENNRWIMVSNHPAWSPVPLPDEAVADGEVVLIWKTPCDAQPAGE